MKGEETMSATSSARQRLARWRTRLSRDLDTRFEIALSDDNVIMRDTKHPDTPALLLSTTEWRAFLRKAQEFETNAASLQGCTETPGEAAASDRWSTIRHAIDRWSTTLRLCMIIICASSPLIMTGWLMLRR
ncbi:DUF397 domain-containing protein [Nonomuraea sp. NPDC055795]